MMDKNAIHDKSEFKVSVIMPVYNGAEFIQKAIESVLVQDMALELIVVDDCSTDKTPDIVNRICTELENHENDMRIQESHIDFDEKKKCLQMNDKVIRYVRNNHNIGAAASRNKGVKMARTSWVAFLDADDWWIAGKLKAQIELLEKNKNVLCCTARALVNAEGQLTGRMIPVKSQITYHELLKHNSVNCSSVVVRTDVMREFPMCHEDSHEDYICWLHILKKYGNACGINKPYLCYRMTEDSKSGNKLKSAKMTFKVYRYMGFNLVKSCILFISYAVHGVLKYGLSGKTKE